MEITRRDFIKTSAAAATAATVGIPLSQTVRAAAEEAEGTYFLDVSREVGITHNRQGIKKAVGQAWGDYDRDKGNLSHAAQR